jgi:hypothetical protein
MGPAGALIALKTGSGAAVPRWARVRMSFVFLARVLKAAGGWAAREDEHGGGAG